MKPVGMIAAFSILSSLTLLSPAECGVLGIGGGEGNEGSSGTNLQLGANNSGDSTRFTGDKKVEIPTPSPGEGSPSTDSPKVEASDPSMWEEQPHQDCVADPQKGYVCVNNGLLQPSGPEEPTGGPRTITITTRQAATLIAQGSGITRQPPGPKVIISKAFIVYTDPTPRYQTTTILDTAIDVEFTPISYTWNWGDGTTTTTTDPGAPLPEPHRHPPLQTHRQEHHHHPDHHLDNQIPPHRPHQLAHNRRHHHHHRNLHPLRPRTHRHLPHRRRRRSPRTLTPRHPHSDILFTNDARPRRRR